MSPEKAWWPPATIKVTNFKCLDETSEPSASDEIFLLVLSVDLTHSISQRMDSLLAQPVVQGMTYRDLLQKAGIDLSAVTEEIPTIPQLDVRLYGPYEDVYEDDTIWIREKPFWYFDGQPRKLNSPDDVIFVIALAELDTGDDQEIARAMMKGTAMVSLASSLNLDRATRADILVRDFCTMNSVYQQVPDIVINQFDLLGVQELPLTNELLEPTGKFGKEYISRAMPVLTFEGHGGKYEVRFSMEFAMDEYLPTGKISLKDFGYTAGGWRVDQHPRFLADLTGDRRADIVGFANAGVVVALNNGDGTFRPPQLVVRDFGYEAGGWRVDRHPRFLADLTGDRCADIVGFANAGVVVALNNGDGTFRPPQLVVRDFGYEAGGWRLEQHPRFLADLTGDGRADIIGFANAGVWVALNNGNGTFQPPQWAVRDFGYEAGGWRLEQHPRFLADLTGDGRADIVGFGNAGVWVALNNGNGTFQPPQLVVSDFGYNAGSWRVENHPRFLADLTGDGRADIIGFGNAGVWVALNNGNGTFQPPQLTVRDFGYEAGGWRVENHPRFLADLTGDGRADIVGFGNAGVWVALNNGNGTFQPPQLVVSDFGYNAGSWRVENHPRFLADLTGDGRADVVGLAYAGVSIALNKGNGTF